LNPTSSGILIVVPTVCFFDETPYPVLTTVSSGKTTLILIRKTPFSFDIDAFHIQNSPS